MKNPDLEIRIGAIAKLRAVLPDMAIRDTMLRPDDETPAIVIGTQTGSREDLKTSFGMQSTLVIQAIGESQSLNVSRYSVDMLTDTILETLIPIETYNFLNVSGFQVVNVMLDSLNDSNLIESNEISPRKIIRLRFILREL